MAIDQIKQHKKLPSGISKTMNVSDSQVPVSLRQRILDCQTEDNWDDEDAIGITTGACDAAVQFLESVLQRNDSIPMPAVSPSVFGTVTLHWRDGGKHLIVRPSFNSVFYRYEQPERMSSYGDESKEEVIQRILLFFSANHAKPN